MYPVTSFFEREARYFFISLRDDASLRSCFIWRYFSVTLDAYDVEYTQNKVTVYIYT